MREIPVRSIFFIETAPPLLPAPAQSDIHPPQARRHAPRPFAAV